MPGVVEVKVKRYLIRTLILLAIILFLPYLATMLITGVKYTRNKSMSTEEVSSVLTMNEYIMGVLAAINPPGTPLES